MEHAGIVEKPAANCREEHHDGAEQRDNYPVAPLSLGWLRLRLVVLLLGGGTGTGCGRPYWVPAACCCDRYCVCASCRPCGWKVAVGG